MKRILLLIYFVTTAVLSELFGLSYENVITGKIKDESTGDPLSYVNIFINNTTWGTTTDLNGSFKLFSISSGKYEIVFSMIGYETQSRIINVGDTTEIFIEILLHPKIYTTKEIDVIAERPEQWFEDLKDFKEKFFGYSSVPIKCSIENEYYLEFEHPHKNILIAKCQVPLKIINYTFGYSISCEVQKFEYDKWSKELKQKYRLYYSELDTSDVEVKQDWAQKRKKMYKKSMYYFLKTLITKKMSETEFDIFLTGNVHAYNPSRGFNLQSTDEILQKNDSAKTYILKFDDYLRVERYSNFYLASISWIKLNYPFITIDEYGYPVEDYAVTLLGSWAKSGIASSLPKNFIIEQNKNYFEE